MQERCLCLKIRKDQSEKAIVILGKEMLINRSYKVRKSEEYILVPILREMTEVEVQELMNENVTFETCCDFFVGRDKKPTSYVDLIEDQLAAHLLASLPRSFDVIGDIAVIEIPTELKDYRSLIGNAVLGANKNLKTVLEKSGAISGTYRIREYSVLAGIAKTETIHKEHGCQFFVDLTKAYFSPRLSNEHVRIASLVGSGETAIDMFAGVGSFAIHIARRMNNVKVYAIDLNPFAFEYMKKNLRLNRVQDQIVPIFGDARYVVDSDLSNIADRVIMNLPERALEFLDVGLRAVKTSGGTIHLYSFIDAAQSLNDIKLKISYSVRAMGREVKTPIFSKMVRPTAPFEWQVAFDIQIVSS